MNSYVDEDTTIARPKKGTKSQESNIVKRLANASMGILWLNNRQLVIILWRTLDATGMHDKQ
jgi:hypothetical protein